MCGIVLACGTAPVPRTTTAARPLPGHQQIIMPSINKTARNRPGTDATNLTAGGQAITPASLHRNQTAAYGRENLRMTSINHGQVHCTSVQSHTYIHTPGTAALLAARSMSIDHAPVNVTRLQSIEKWCCELEMSMGRVDPRLGSGQDFCKLRPVGSGRKF